METGGAEHEKKAEKCCREQKSWDGASREFKIAGFRDSGTPNSLRTAQNQPVLIHVGLAPHDIANNLSRRTEG